MTLMPAIALAAAFAVSLGAQEPTRPANGAQPAVVAAPWSEGAGQGATYRGALANAIAAAVAASRGADFPKGTAMRARLRVIAEHDAGDRTGAFDGGAARERAWVLGQLVGVVDDYLVTSKGKADGAAWDVRVRVRAAAAAAVRASLVVELDDGGLGSWELERFEEAGRGQAFDRRRGRFEGPPVATYLRRSGAVKLAGPRSGGDSRAATSLVPSHRVVLSWQPLRLRSTVEKPNPARPTKGPRPERLSGGVADVTVRVEDLVQGVVLLSEKMSIQATAGQAWPTTRMDAYVNELVDRAKAQVAQRIYFAMCPPVVLRKWAGQGGAWHVEVEMPARLARGGREFAAGNDGGLSSPDWERLAVATFVGGSAASCTFRLEGLTDASAVDVGVTEVRPVR